jgi:ADP-ribose pyrophosphatase YjhB (NUDIX family)
MRNLIWTILGAITIGVRVIALKNNEVLLVRHTYKLNWHLPGGGIKRKETLVEAANRELYEETGAKVDNLELVGVFTNFSEGRNDHIVLFSGNIVKLDNIKNREISEVKFVCYNDLPQETDNQCRQKIQEFLEHKKPLTGLW